MTLIEVVGGLALLATLLVALLMAKGRYTRQAAAADRRLRAVAAADALLAGWHQDPNALARSGRGAIPGESQLSWRTLTLPNPAANELGADVIRLDILDGRSGAPDTPLTSVEFLVDPVPVKSPTTREKSLSGRGSLSTHGKGSSKTSKKLGATPAAK